MNLLRITPFIHVEDMEGTLAFFRDTLGFSVDFHADNYAFVRRDGVAVRILAEVPHTHEGEEHDHVHEPLPKGGRRYRYYIDVADLAGLHAELKPRLDRLSPGDVEGPVDQPYGQRELTILAPDGDLLVFGQAIEA